ncbi:g7221 [Coccomyxa elongata]
MLGTANGDLLGGFGASSYRKGSAKWSKACKAVCLVLLASGALMALISITNANSSPRVTGMILGALLGLAGVAGFAGGHSRSANLLNMSVVVSIIGLLIAFQFIGEVGRETEVDCALAELYVRGLATERLVKDQHQAEIFNSIYTRMNEMEDMLDLVQHGAIKALDLRAKQDQLRETDQAYIHAKLQQLHHHAEAMLESVLQNPNITEESVRQMAQHEKDALQNRIDLADQALVKIKAKHNQENFTLSLPEYEEILDALVGSHYSTVPDHLSHENHHELGALLMQAKAELPNMQGALERTQENQYHLYNVDGAGDEITELARVRAEKQKEWEQKFTEHLQRREQSHADVSWLQSMPQHCVQESRSKTLLIGSGLLAAALQLVAVYVILSLLLRIPIKGD